MFRLRSHYGIFKRITRVIDILFHVWRIRQQKPNSSNRFSRRMLWAAHKVLSGLGTLSVRWAWHLTQKSETREVEYENYTSLTFLCSWNRHQELVLSGQTVNQHFDLQVLRRFREDKRNFCDEVTGSFITTTQLWHTALSVNHYLPSEELYVIPHLPYSAGLGPCAYFLFLRMKNHLKGKHF